MTDMTGDHHFEQIPSEKIVRNKWMFWIAGVFSILAGSIAIIAPHVATLAAELTIGALLLVNGVVLAVLAFRAEQTGEVIVSIITGVLSILTGALLLAFPLGGILALTTVLAAYFLVAGAVKLYFGIRARPADGWGWLTAGGALSALLGLFIVIGLPGSAFWVLGLMLGIDLIMFGAGLFAAVSIARRHQRDAG